MEQTQPNNDINTKKIDLNQKMLPSLRKNESSFEFYTSFLTLIDDASRWMKIHSFFKSYSHFKIDMLEIILFLQEFYSTRQDLTNIFYRIDLK